MASGGRVFGSGSMEKLVRSIESGARPVDEVVSVAELGGGTAGLPVLVTLCTVPGPGDWAGLARRAIAAGASASAACCVEKLGGWHPPLWFAISSGKAGVVEVLVRAGADMGAADACGAAALYHAVHFGQTECARILLEAGADVNGPNGAGWTPLHAAVLLDSIPLVVLLLQHGADVTTERSLGRFVTPIMFAKSEFVEKLLRKKHRVGRCGYPLCDGGEGGKLLGCSLCNRVFYCSKACQRAHWREHKKKECGVSYKVDPTDEYLR
ncbi:hypothetical protein TeGR_g13463 [Tetraparma gracilis]|uniref:MYND-type domain-containing protein n=1 Tax=Tetraparma gracilis TaxID=2962635 RepID=A0ABQ6N0X1_9STRA|nr:hypothetical protein TeGR_g13463 [Tetraparma gracilis]